ncbi:hypothetical protein [Amycolatopsis sp. Hca4]|uniref:hypothetical protein n=1 Tax=Amycolatopsis sp. Hca4 TaxID=2742131 RepID=UPI00159089C6|nr:hypothetical protein [Amycolatopsis sp. Hca4]QKV74531.1 hypothetical protein HUT10_12695 [Amycolatopsis sp. Hca4]
MSWIPVTPKPRFLAWTGSNLAEWQERWPNAEIVEGGKLMFGPSIVADVGDGMVEGGGVSIWWITAADFAEQFDVVAEE